jgi:hypothetical protein
MSNGTNSNELPDGWTDLIDLCNDMIDGANGHPEVALKQWTGAALTGLRDTAKAKKREHQDAVKAEADVTTARKLANSNAKGFIAAAQRMLLDTFGSQPKKAWEAAGWPSGIIAAPNTIDGREKLLDKLVPWLTANPAKEVAVKQFTAAQAGLILGALTGPMGDLPGKVRDRVKAAAADVTAEKALRNGMSGLVGRAWQSPRG